ncbi:capreomycidine synthase [Nonomuraea lactucae]|uniref:capreomycidine synthase n=1 Tax=Nonomuraea lactucae TaxID=2249762 RepID=UPI000DE3E0AE|nr:capreomycidine synthase [Nonomuraea lactucae]
MRYESAALEDWMRHYYFSVDFDIGSSGVEDYSVADLRKLLDIDSSEFDEIVLRDSTTLGGEEVRAAIADQWGNGDPDWAMVTHGASEAIYLVMSTLLDPGDEIVVLDPAYHTHHSIARTLGCTVVPWRMDASDSYRADFDLLRTLVGPRTKAIVVNFPHNPTGASLTARERDELVGIAADSSAYLVWDQAFRELTYGEEPLRDPVLDYPRAISIGTLSKGYGLPGLRVGWCIAHPDVLHGTFDLRDRTTLHLSPLVEFLACRVARGADRLLAGRLNQAGHNLGLLREWSRRNADLVDLVEPRGGVTTFPRLIGFVDTTDFCHDLARRHRVLLVPGVCFGDPQRVRLGFGGPTRAFERGLDELGRALRGHHDHQGADHVQS